ncbi:MAG: rod shape-determining protein MreC [Acidimicrobiia bacterium]
MWRPSNLDRPTGMFIGLIVLSLALVTIDLRASGEGIGSTLRDGTQAAFAPVQRVVATVTRPFADFFETISDMFSLRQENLALRERVSELERELQETESVQVRVSELEALLGIKPPQGLDSVAAQVLAVGVSEFDHTRVIDRGSNDGVGLDMPVVDEAGLIGRVVAVTGSVARIRLITDPTMRIWVRVERTGETGVLTGRGGGPMSLELLSTDASVVEGDLLVSADGRFPAGIPVARVTEAARSEVGFSLRTTAEPVAGVTRIDFVKVLIFTRDEAGVDGFEDADRLPTQVPADPGDPAEGGPDDPVQTTTTTSAQTTTTTTAP